MLHVIIGVACLIGIYLLFRHTRRQRMLGKIDDVKVDQEVVGLKKELKKEVTKLKKQESSL